MIVDLPSTTTSAISARLIDLRDEVGAMALSRVLTLIVSVEEEHAEDAITVANLASHQHPARIIVAVAANRRAATRLDAQIRVGGDAGASEVIIVRLYGQLAGQPRAVVTPLLLADSPIVTWWPVGGPKDPGADPLGALAQRRITDAAKATTRPRTTLRTRAASYAPGDTDLAWTRITLWRGLLAAALDQAPYEPITSATVDASASSPSGDLLAAWLHHRLDTPVTVTRRAGRSGVVGVELTRASGTIVLRRPQDGDVATLQITGSMERRIALPHRGDAECLADELRRLDPDEVYHDALTKGLSGLR